MPTRIPIEEHRLLVQLLKTGSSKELIATELYISSRTVPYRIKALLKELGARNTKHALLEAKKIGWL